MCSSWRKTTEQQEMLIIWGVLFKKKEKEKKPLLLGCWAEQRHIKDKTHLHPATCSTFSLLLQVPSRPSPACPSCAGSFKTLHAHSFPSQLSPALLKYQRYHPPLHDPSSLSIIWRSPFRPSSSRVSQKKVSAAAEACSRRRARLRRHVFNANMDSVRDRRCCLIFL